MKKLIAGNWKMNFDGARAENLAREILSHAGKASGVEYLVCPPFIYLERVVKILQGSAVAVGAQDCSAQDNGAHTGDVSASMIKEAGAGYVILGHSERRAGHKESDEAVNAKARKAHEHGLITIICVGETEQEREQGREQEIVSRQLRDSIPSCATSANTVIAYEPVWAIGTGKNATPEDAGAMHSFIRQRLAESFPDPEKVRILYGGSMNSGNAGALLSTGNIDGGLIGGASLKTDSFIAIAQSVQTD